MYINKIKYFFLIMFCALNLAPSPDLLGIIESPLLRGKIFESFNGISFLEFSKVNKIISEKCKEIKGPLISIDTPYKNEYYHPRLRKFRIYANFYCGLLLNSRMAVQISFMSEEPREIPRELYLRNFMYLTANDYLCSIDHSYFYLDLSKYKIKSTFWQIMDLMQILQEEGVKSENEFLEACKKDDSELSQTIRMKTSGSIIQRLLESTFIPSPSPLEPA